jgi:hypothetical protein
MRALLDLAADRPVAASPRLDLPAGSDGHAARPAHLPSRRELRTLLSIAGTRPAPPPSPVFVATTGASLRGAAPGAVVIEPLPRRERRARTPAVLTGAAAAVLTLVLVGALTGVYDGVGSDNELSLGVSVDTTVVLPDGTTVDAKRGLTLPDGAVIRTGPSGRTVVGDVTVGPGLELVVDAGELRPADTADAIGAAPAAPVTLDPEPQRAPAAVGDSTTATASASGGPTSGPRGVPAVVPPITTPPTVLSNLDLRELVPRP